MFSKIRLLIELIFLIIVIIAAVFFAMSNEASVTIDYLVSVIEAPIGVALIFMFVLGGIIGFVVRLPSTWALRAKLAQTRKKLVQLQAQTGTKSETGLDA